MKKYSPVLFTSLAGGLTALVLRLLQNRSGFEPDTGLPAPGHPLALVLPLTLAALAAVLLVLSRRLPSETGDTPLSFSSYFYSRDGKAVTLMVMGIFLWLISGALEVYAGFSAPPVITGNAAPVLDTGVLDSSRLSLFMGLLSILAGAALLPLIPACRRGGKRAVNRRTAPAALNSNLLLIPVICLVVRLVLVYREDSINPTLAAYYVELLALSFLILSLYRASSFAFHCGRTRRFALYASCALVLCIATLADGHSLADTLLYLGSVFLLLSLLLMRATAGDGAPPAASKEKS